MGPHLAKEQADIVVSETRRILLPPVVNRRFSPVRAEKNIK